MIQSLVKPLKYLPLHLALWVLVWLFFVYFFSYSSENTDFVFWFSNSLLPITMVTTYMFAYYLIPRYLLTKRYVAFTAYALATIICSVYAVLLLTFIIFVFLSNFDINQMPLLTRNFIFVFILVYLVVGVVSFVQLLRHHYTVNASHDQLEKKFLEGKLQLKQKELHYLKQQIHPHFLFNTLNTIYGFALKESKQTPELILKLSNLLDYTLNQIEKPTVSLSEEINYIDSYVGLEQVRFRDSLRIRFTKEIVNDVHVPPMLFMPFIENAFKHGAVVDDFLDIEMTLEANKERLVFTIENDIKSENKNTENHGLGIVHSRKRLNALYPDSYELKTTEDAGRHTLFLAIYFKKHIAHV